MSAITPTTPVLPVTTNETVFSRKYLYDGIQNIQFSDDSYIVYLKNAGDRVYLDVKFTEYSTYQIYADIEFNGNPSVTLQPGIIYPGTLQHPVKLISRKVLKPNVPNTYVLVGQISLLQTQGLAPQPVFIRNATTLLNKIHIKRVKIVGTYKIDYAYTEWWNQETNTGKRPFQHANHIVSNSIFSNIVNPRHMYREMIILKWHMHTYATAINGPSTYMGIDFAEGRIVFSVWNANKDGVETPNTITFVGKNVESNKFDHEGSGSYFTLKYNKYNTTPLTIGHKYGFYIRYNELEDGNTEYSAYFINLGPQNAPIADPQWILIGKVLHYNTFIVDNRIGGFLENYMTANGHLYQRSVAIGNGWASNDGITWVSSTHEEAVMDELSMQQASPYLLAGADAGYIRYSIGGRLGTSDSTALKKHGNLRSFDIYRTATDTQQPPVHLTNVTVDTLL